jgi:hypothetical protein
MNDEIMQGLEAAFADEDDAPAEIGDAPAELADEDVGDAEELTAETEEGDEAADDAEATEADEPEGRKYLSLVGPDGKARRVHIDELLAGTQHDVTVDGEKRFVSYDELRNGYQRQADYTRKTMELAKERGDLAPFAQMVAHAKKDPDFVRHVQAYFQQGPRPDLQAAARADMADEQIAALLDSSDRQDVDRAKEILRARAQLRTVLSQRQQYEQAAQAEQQQLLEGYLAAEREKVSTAIPDYPKQAPAIAAALRDLYGFTEAELKGVYDSRLVRVAHDAMLYRKSLEDGSKLGLEGKRKPLPPPRAAKPGAGKATSAKEIRRSKDLTARAMRSGQTDDWASVIANRLGLS